MGFAVMAPPSRPRWSFESRWRTPIPEPGTIRDPSIVLRAERALTIVAVVVPSATGPGDPHGNNPGAADLVAWTSQDGGDSFGPGVRINPKGSVVAGTGETAPALALGPKGLCVAYEERLPGGSGTRLVSSWSAMGTQWSEPTSLEEKGVPSSNGYVSLGAGADGTMAVAWLDGRRKDPRGPDLMLAISPDNGRTWTNAKALAAGACPCCRPGVAVAPDGRIAVTYRNVEPGNIRDIFMTTSSDGGRTFSSPRLVARDGWRLDGCPHSGAPVAFHDGRWHVVWYSGGRGPREAGLRHASADARTAGFGPPGLVGGSTLDPNHPMLLSAGGTLNATFQARPARGDGWEPYAAHLTRLAGPVPSDKTPTECSAAGIGVHYPRSVQDATGRIWMVSSRQGHLALRRGRRLD